MSSNNKIILTTSQILEAHAAHGNDFIVINFESTRKFKNFAQYIDIDVKLADGKTTPVRYWKLSNEGIVVGSRLRKPEQRKYESIRMGVGLKDEDGVENANVKALQLLCEAFEEKMKQFKTDDIITDDARAPRKQADGTYRPFHLISTKIVSPMQTTAKDKETDDIVDLANPFFWLSIPKKKFFRNGEIPHESAHFEDKYYADEMGQPDMARPIMTHLYSPDFYNVEDFYHHPRTGKKIYKHLGAPDGDDNYMDNTNIQDYLTKGSALMGNLKFELAVSGRQCKLDVALYGRFYVKKEDVVDGPMGGQDDDAIDAFTTKYQKLTISKGKKDEDFEEEEFVDDD
ncbi:hypothetical protein PC129_g14823 [Phytophthora cactorum]|uniref:Uncharacterized protein n=1 Tax=Phytophthora cactorum TaxID=29920 RepID=A0A329RQB6_9STRA|nr:hypothetical protein Pcac1_g28559 [Phytophthora cactorum]KAG2809471.1 hypothetical protein PC112_g16498 [Phytophthora cactorum]KAG2811104.1 hypothetical protein PC111_g15377 [Phytophthora cactorum]KAG2850742.1 hypothetical protein PC113_g16506 [Phytophthora cactorum]KAG2901268.1 hypothetical protein PC115_g15932 [Phytophthora cactorum]